MRRRRSRASARRYWLPPWLRIRRLPGVVPIALGVLLFGSAVVKVPMMATSCESAFEAANALMIPLELVCGVMLLRARWGRRAAALLWALLMPGAAVYLAYMHHRGFDVRSCGCFGPVKLEFTTHLMVLAGLFVVAALVFLREETRQLDALHGREGGDPRALTELARRFR